jgi:osmotically inducible protein OsmC
MAIRKSDAEWHGGLMTGDGTMELGSGAFKGPFSFKSRMENGTGTNPEELIAAAHAGCFSMQFSAMLEHAGFPPERVHTTAQVYFGPDGPGFSISKIELTTEGTVPGIDDAQFQELAASAKANCPVSKALASVPITLQATLA